MSLDDAIAVLEAEVALFGVGTREQPKPDTPEFFIVRAKSVGLSMLKQMRATGLIEPTRAEAFYRQTSRAAKLEPDNCAVAEPQEI